VPAEVVSYLQTCEGPGGRDALQELQKIVDEPPQRKKVAYRKGSSGCPIALEPDAPRTSVLRTAARTARYFDKTHRYLSELERQDWRCCGQCCLLGVDKRMIISRSTIWGAKEVAQRRRDLMDLIAWCKVWAQGSDAHYELRLFGRPVCTRAFAAAHGETVRTFSRRRAEVDRAVGDHIPSNVANKPPARTPGPRRDGCATWLRDTLSKMAQPLPNKTVRGPCGEQRTLEFLPTGIFTTLKDVYQYYCGHVLSQPDLGGVERRPASFQTFRRAWLANYFQVGRDRQPKRCCHSGRSSARLACAGRTRKVDGCLPDYWLCGLAIANPHVGKLRHQTPIQEKRLQQSTIKYCNLYPYFLKE
jgi:hypothetical protein